MTTVKEREETMSALTTSVRLRSGLWRVWLVAAVVWTIAVLWFGAPYLTADCFYFAQLVDKSLWQTCRYAPDAMQLPALAWLLLPPPFVFVLGYWIVRGFRPGGKINKRIAIGVHD
jgi:H+/Cl- antiporter ClcA